MRHHYRVMTLVPLKHFLQAALLWLVIDANPLAPALHAQTNSGHTRFETEIKAFEVADKTNPPPTRAVLFVGSSSIRLWETLAQDFPRAKVINRGFGGSQIADSLAYADRIILPYRPKTVVLYAGDNEIAAGKSPEEVFADFKALARTIHRKLPRTRVRFISIKPSPSRWRLADKIKAANQLIAEFCGQDKRLAYIDVFSPMLGTDGRPRPELFVKDKLHLNAQGYELWARIVAPHLK
jgi:lysophospholipase L1-like esterase